MRRVSLNRSKNIQRKLLPKVISTGFFGGIIWGLIAAFFGYFNFTSVTPKTFILRPFIQSEWTDRWMGQLLSILILSILSIGIALLYYYFLKKVDGISPGLVLGVVLWFIFFWLLEPLLHNIPKFYQLDSDTVVTTMCLFILYGVFIGYSISFAYHQNLGEN